MPIRLIGLYSPGSGYGKDTVGTVFLNKMLTIPHSNKLTFSEIIRGRRRDILQYGYWEIKKFAYSPKKIVADIIGVPVEKMEDREWRSSIIPPFKKSPFDMLIEVSQGMKSLIYENIWIDTLFKDFKENSRWIITDLRFPVEYQAIKDLGGMCIRIDNPKCTYPKQAMDGLLDDYKFDDYIVNDPSGVKYMIGNVKRIIKDYHLEIPNFSNIFGEEEIDMAAD